VVLHDFVVEDGEVESESELDWVARWECDLISLLVSFESLGLDLLKLLSSCVLRDVAIVVSHHLDEESLGLSITSLVKNLGVDHFNDSFTVSSELVLNAGLVVSESLREFGVLWVLLDSSNGPAGSAFAGDEVLEGNREKVTLIRGDILALSIKHACEIIDHIFKSFSLLSDTSEEDVLFYLGILVHVQR
jgi:hypothetical protein